MSGAWEGWFKAGRVRPDGTTEHIFAPGDEYGEYNEILGECGRKGGKVRVHLYWNDPIQPAGFSNQQGDYGLVALTEKEGKLVPLTEKKGNDEEKDIKDTAAHTHGEKPYRHISFPAPNRTGSNRTWIVITKAAGAPDQFLHLDIKPDASGCKLQYMTGGAITGHHGAEAAFSVASKSSLKRDFTLGRP